MNSYSVYMLHFVEPINELEAIVSNVSKNVAQHEFYDELESYNGTLIVQKISSSLALLYVGNYEIEKPFAILFISISC